MHRIRFMGDFQLNRSSAHSTATTEQFDPHTSPRRSTRRQRLDQQPHLGPRRLRPHRGRSQQQPQPSPRLGGKLQAAKRPIAQPLKLAESRSHPRTAQRLFERPEEIGGTGGPDDEHVGRRNPQRRRRRGIELPGRIDHHEDPAALQHGDNRPQGAVLHAASLCGRQPLHQGSPAEASFRKQLVERGDPGRNHLSPRRRRGPGTLQLSDLPGKLLDNLGAGCVTSHGIIRNEEETNAGITRSQLASTLISDESSSVMKATPEQTHLFREEDSGEELSSCSHDSS